MQNGSDSDDASVVEPWFPLITSEEWTKFEIEADVAKPWTTYEQPQKSGGLLSSCVYGCLRISCCCPCREACLCCCKPCCHLERVRFTSPDDWFGRMLSYSNPDCPDQLKGIWWLEDNVAGEGVISMQGANWISADESSPYPIGLITSKYNWTVDAYTAWGNFLTANFWLRGGRHQFQFSPNGKWISIEVSTGRGHFIYLLQPGDVVEDKNGDPIDFTPGEDMMRISFESFDPKSPIIYQYLVRRVAYLASDGRLVKTKNFGRMQQIVSESKLCRECCYWYESSSPDYHDLKNIQVLSYPPSQDSM